MTKKLSIYFLCVLLIVSGTMYTERQSRAFVVLILPGIEIVMSAGGVAGLASVAAGIGLTAWLLRFKGDSSSTAINVRLNPKAAATVPAGWSAAANANDDPVPPSSSPTVSGYNVSTGYCGGCTAFGASISAAGAALIPIINANSPGTAPHSVCDIIGNTVYIARNGDAPAACHVAGPQATASPVESCPVGYTLSGGTCNLTTPAVVRYPSDGQCEMKLVGGTFTYDSRDPDCDGTPPSNYVVTGSGKVITVSAGNEKSVLTSNPDNSLKVENWKGNGDGTSQYTAATFSAPDGGSADGGTAVTGFSSARVMGEGSLAGTTPSTATDSSTLAKDATVAATNSKLDGIKAGQCGGAGQPQCNVKVDETGTPAATDIAAAGKTTLEGKTPESFGVTPWSGAGISIFSGLPSLTGSDSCVNPPLSWTFMGNTITPDLCAVWSPLKPFFAWLIYALTALYIWRRTTRALGGE